MINVHIADDHIMVVESLSAIINASKRAMQVTNAYYTLKECRKGLSRKLPDILLLDIEMPDGHGIDFCAEMMKVYPKLKIIMLTAYKTFTIAKYALRYGARGYLLKNADVEEMFDGIEKVYQGEQFLCKEIDTLLEDKSKSSQNLLTNTEKRILQLRAQGYTLKEIGESIHRDEETIKTHLKNARIKLDAKNTIEAITIGYKINEISLY
jgi:DNA-binding NarL/FixJ family response regulator